MLPYALWADRTTHSSVELMTGKAPVMLTKTAIATWTMLPWKEEMSREELLAVRIRQLEGSPVDIAEATRRQQEARFRCHDVPRPMGENVKKCSSTHIIQILVTLKINQ